MAKHEAPGRIEEVFVLDGTPYLLTGQKDDFEISVTVIALDPTTGERVRTIGRIEVPVVDGEPDGVNATLGAVRSAFPTLVEVNEAVAERGLW